MEKQDVKMKIEYFDKEGKPLTLMEWVDLWENKEYKFIKRTYLKNCWISSVWLGLDHDFFGYSDKPVIFESMAFPNDDSFYDIDQERYSTEEECLVGHDAMVERWKNKELEE